MSDLNESSLQNHNKKPFKVSSGVPDEIDEGNDEDGERASKDGEGERAKEMSGYEPRILKRSESSEKVGKWTKPNILVREDASKDGKDGYLSDP